MLKKTPIEKTLSSSKIINSILSLVGGTIFSRVIAFFATAYVARVLGPEGFGIVGFAVAISGYLSLFITAGVNIIGTREIAKCPENAASLAASIILFRFLLASIAFILIGVIAWLLPKPFNVQLVVFLTGLSFFSLSLDTAWVHKGLEQNSRVGIAIVLTEIIQLGLLLLLVKNPDDLFFVPVTLFVGQLIAAIILMVPIFKNKGFKPKFKQGVGIFKSSHSLLYVKLLRTLIFSFDIVILGFLSTEVQIGYYNAAYRICFFLLSISYAFSSAYLPDFSRAVKGGASKVSDLAGRSFELCALVSTPFIVGGIIVAGPLLTTIFGKSYGVAEPALRLLLISTGCIFMRVIVGNVLLVYNLLKTQLWIMIVGCSFNIALDFLLIPAYGIVGAGFATAFADTLILIIGYLIIYRNGIYPDWKPLKKIAFANVVMGGLLILFKGQLNIFLTIAIGGLIYIVTIVLLKAVPRDILPYLNQWVGKSRKMEEN